MTFSQQARTEGFLEQIPIRGHVLLLNGSGIPVAALFEKAEPERYQHELEHEVANATIVHVLRTHLESADLNPIIGHSWHEGDTRYRIKAIRDQSLEVAVIYICETSKAP